MLLYWVSQSQNQVYHKLNHEESIRTQGENRQTLSAIKHE